MKKSRLTGILPVIAFLVFSLLIAITVSAQQKEISGTVTSSDGAPIPGVTIVLKGTSSGTITDIDGKFAISVPADISTIIVSYIGMLTQEVEIGRTHRARTQADEKAIP